VTRFVFSEMAIRWLEENRFSEEDIEQLQDTLNALEYSIKKGEQRLRLPKDSTPNVSTLVSLLDSITDVDGRPICFEDSGLIEIPSEARNYFEEDLELDELERVSAKLKKVKFARRYSAPRKRGTMKDEKFPLE
jgi:hypothetical protein